MHWVEEVGRLDNFQEKKREKQVKGMSRKVKKKELEGIVNEILMLCIQVAHESTCEG